MARWTGMRAGLAKRSGNAGGVKALTVITRGGANMDHTRFTHYCGRTRKGSFKVKRRTSAQKRRAKIREIKGWLQKQRRCMKTGQILRGMRAKLEGHLEYYAITDNTPSCDLFRTQLTELLYKWLNRRSQRRSYTWQRFNDALRWVGWPSVRVRHNLCPFRVGPE